MGVMRNCTPEEWDGYTDTVDSSHKKNCKIQNILFVRTGICYITRIFNIKTTKDD